MANSSAIGKRGENQVAELLREYWNDPHFIRNWFGDSGGVGTMLDGNPHVPPYILEALSSDIVAPLDFPFCVESKLYKEIDLYAIMRNPQNCDIAVFWKQVKRDSQRIGKIPLVIFREKGRGKKHHVIHRETDFDKFSRLTKKPRKIDFVVEDEVVSICRWEDFVECYPKELIA